MKPPRPWHCSSIQLILIVRLCSRVRSRYQKTETALKSTAEKTTSFLGGIGTGLSAKIGAVKNSDTFRSMEEKVGTVYSSVRVRRSRVKQVICRM